MELSKIIVTTKSTMTIALWIIPLKIVPLLSIHNSKQTKSSEHGWESVSITTLTQALLGSQTKINSEF